MKITEKQLMIMLRVLEGTLSIADSYEYDILGYTQFVRRSIYDEIINQQSDALIDVKEVPNAE